MVRHCVLFKMSASSSAPEIDECLRGLAAVAGALPGLLDFVGGRDVFPETRNRGYTHGFVMTFDTAAHRDAYLTHPDHVALATRVWKLVDGGKDGTLIVNFDELRVGV